MCSLCEETGQSCRGPANHNSVALILPQKAMLSFHGGAIGSNLYNDRAGIHCRNVVDSVKVLDALKNPVNGYYDSAGHLHHREPGDGARKSRMRMRSRLARQAP